MIIDIRKDLPRFRKYLEERLAQHLRGPKKSKPVHRIDFGFEFGQQNWVALVFDTREDAEPDGEWANMIKKADFLQNPRWPIWLELPEEEQVSFINLAGRTINVMRDPDNLICEIVGEALKHTLITARDEDLFQALPKAKKCELGVENLEGYYGWPNYEDRGKKNLVQ
jgi:hypothetical protein